MIVGALGLLLVGIGLIGLIDPVGSKMSDDSDPFGATTGFLLQGSLVVLAGGAIMACGAYLIWRIDNNG
jgi:hypothetical protein